MGLLPTCHQGSQRGGHSIPLLGWAGLGCRKMGSARPGHRSPLPSPPQHCPQQVHLHLPLLWRPKPGPAGAGEALCGQPPQRPQPCGEPGPPAHPAAHTPPSAHGALLGPGDGGLYPTLAQLHLSVPCSRCVPSARRCPGVTPVTRVPTSCSTCSTGTSSPMTPLWCVSCPPPPALNQPQAHSSSKAAGHTRPPWVPVGATCVSGGPEAVRSAWPLEGLQGHWI